MKFLEMLGFGGQKKEEAATETTLPPVEEMERTAAETGQNPDAFTVSDPEAEREESLADPKLKGNSFGGSVEAPVEEVEEEGQQDQREPA